MTGVLARLILGTAVAWSATAAAVAAPLPVDLTTLPQPAVALTGQGQNEYLGMPFGIKTGARIEGDCDLDGDGRDDLVAAGAAWTTPSGGTQTGRVHIVRGRAGWVSGTLPATAETIAVAGHEEGKRFGEQVTCAGDVDGDGIDDLAVGMGGGAPGTSVYAYLVWGATDLFARGSFTVGSAPGRAVAIDYIGGGTSLAVPTQWARYCLPGTGRQPANRCWATL